MATYVTSDTHGHLCALQEALAAAGVTPESLEAGDKLYVLGDMIDRGPDPLGVINFVRALPNTQALMGNHEQLMLVALSHVAPPENGHISLEGMNASAFADWIGWTQNGGGTTIEQLEKLDEDTYLDLISWVQDLSFYEVVQVGEDAAQDTAQSTVLDTDAVQGTVLDTAQGTDIPQGSAQDAKRHTAQRTYVLVHAGIDPKRANYWRYKNPEASMADPANIEKLMAAQELEDLVWIRDEFWSGHTGLIEEDGTGSVVIAGHTPSLTLSLCCPEEIAFATEFKTADDKGLVVALGADDTTGNVADRIDIDAAAAAAYPFGRVAVMRLEDGEIFYADVKEGE